jgi:DNA-binding transcriptional ArsR family regulator
VLHPTDDRGVDRGIAADLAHGFKALGDPVRLRLLSLIASRAGGAAEVRGTSRSLRRGGAAPVPDGEARSGIGLLLSTLPQHLSRRSS